MAGFWIPDRVRNDGEGAVPPGLVSGVNKFIGYNHDAF